MDVQQVQADPSVDDSAMAPLPLQVTHQLAGTHVGQEIQSQSGRSEHSRGHLTELETNSTKEDHEESSSTPNASLTVSCPYATLQVFSA